VVLVSQEMEMKPLIAVVDYGLGNIRSVSKAMELAGAEALVSSDAGEIKRASGMALPGVGAFGRGMDNLKKAGLIGAVMDRIAGGKPCLGICLGLQMLFSLSGEHGSSKGMDIIKGRVRLFKNDLKIPHMGWNRVKFRNRQGEKGGMFEGIADGSYFYFVHSYYVLPDDASIIASTSDYGGEFVSSIAEDNLWATQFHPEKSGAGGLKLLQNFVKKCGGKQ
jgi:glutamine amidotransferase